VLFVVYRPEWWGCFDSLCVQECEKEHVTCHVMLIPRYERDKNTGIRDENKRHFDLKAMPELPSNAVLLDYEKFSSEQRFDRIYIHNPYDNTYVVDSVDEAYYSVNLKKQTDKLIYVPHLLYMGGLPENMLYCPVYEHVDAIYLSDERVRYSLDVRYDEKVELVPCGILEYLDKLNAKKDAECLGEEDGSRRKRLLYCVSFEDLFYGTEKQIQKMWDVFRYMPTRDDIEFVFRPDENIRARYRELPGNIVVKYEELLSYYKGKNIGILDESLNPYQAAVEADGIMTAGHPMSALFSVQGKYVLYVDRESRPIPTEEDRCIPSIWACTVEEKDGEIIVWFVPERTRLICRMELSKGQVEIVSEVPDEVVTWSNYIDIAKVGECLYLAPFMSNGIWKYDLEKKVFCKWYLPGAEEVCMSRIVPYENWLYFIPRNYPGIIKYHLDTEEIRIIDDWVEVLDSCVASDKKKEPYFIWAIRREGNMLYMASSKCDVWIEMNLDTDEWRVEKMGLEGLRFADMVKDGENVYLFPYRGADIVQWNCRTKESRVLYTVKESGAVPHVYAGDVKDEIIAFPVTAEKILVVSKRQDKLVGTKTEGLPCHKEDYISESLKLSNMGYRFVRQLQKGVFLAYEQYDGAFLLINEEFQVEQKVICRVLKKEIAKQSCEVWMREEYKLGFGGQLYERMELPVIIDCFAKEKWVSDREIRSFWENYLR